MKKMSMRLQIVILFICLMFLPILCIYTFASFVFAQSTTKDLQSIYVKNVEAMGRSLDAIFSSTIELSQYPLTEETLREYLTADPVDVDYDEKKTNATYCLDYLFLGYRSAIRDIGIHTEAEDSLVSSENVMLTAEDQRTLEKTGADIHWDFSSCVTSLDNIYLVRHLRSANVSSQYMGYVKLSLARSDLKESMRRSELNKQTSYFVVTPLSQVVVSLDSAHFLYYGDSLQTYTNLQEHISQGEHSWIKNDRIVSAYALNNGLLLYSISQPKLLSQVNNSFFVTMSLATASVMVFCILLSTYFSRIITNPLKRLGQHMMTISQGNFTDRIENKGCSEIRVLTENYNEMAEKLERLYNEVYISELKLKQSQLDILQAQLNPHFLYNTLDTIYWMARMGETEQVSAMVSNLSQMMRLSLSPRINDKITLKQEIEHLLCYISIEKIRYGKKVCFEIDCQKDLEEVMVLNLLLQPIVENALIHGLANSLNGIIRIHIYREEGTLVYEVANNGVPIDEEEIRLILNDNNQSLKGLALRNLHERIRLKYGKDYSLSCYRDREFSVFRITQPIEGGGKCL